MRDLQIKMNRIYNWCLLNKLTINKAKTKYMMVSTNTISIAGTVLGRVCHYEYLGMSIENKVNIDRQIESMY